MNAIEQTLPDGNREALSYRDGSILQIDLAAIAQNYKKIQELSDGAEVAAVVKADGYGLGAVRVVEALYEKGCNTFFVAHFNEALLLRTLHKDITIYVLNGLHTADRDDFATYNIIPVLNNIGDIKNWGSHARSLERYLPAAIHFDTGMNRMGLGTLERQIFFEQKNTLLQGLQPKLVMSHFSAADEDGHPETVRQAALFDQISKQLEGVPASLANSAGIFANKTYHYDLVRPGMALYGLNPMPYALSNPMTPVITLRAKILNIQDVPSGEHVGYGATYRLKGNERLATVCVGYADGFARSIGQNGHLYWNGIACPFRGRVSMDLATVSIDHITDNPPQIGDSLEIIGPHQSPEILAKNVAGGTIDYEILTSLGRRYKKVYVS